MEPGCRHLSTSNLHNLPPPTLTFYTQVKLCLTLPSPTAPTPAQTPDPCSTSHHIKQLSQPCCTITWPQLTSILHTINYTISRLCEHPTPGFIRQCGPVAKAIGFVRQSAAAEHQLGAVVGRQGLLRFWDCCGAGSEGAPGCCTAHHITFDADFNRQMGWESPLDH